MTFRKRFFLAELFLVVIPCVVGLAAYSLVIHLPSIKSGTLIAFLFVFMFVFSFYLLPAIFFTPNEFVSGGMVAFPGSITGWLVVVATYTVLAFIVSLVITFFHNLNNTSMIKEPGPTPPPLNGGTSTRPHNKHSIRSNQTQQPINICQKEKDALLAYYQTWSTDDLITASTVNKQDYAKEALDLIKREIIKRESEQNCTTVSEGAAPQPPSER